jgi:hypothetical protein
MRPIAPSLSYDTPDDVIVVQFDLSAGAMNQLMKWCASETGIEVQKVNKKFGDDARSIPTSHNTPRDTGTGDSSRRTDHQFEGKQSTNPTQGIVPKRVTVGFDCPSPRLGPRIGERNA